MTSQRYKSSYMHYSKLSMCVCVCVCVCVCLSVCLCLCQKKKSVKSSSDHTNQAVCICQKDHHQTTQTKLCVYASEKNSERQSRHKKSPSDHTNQAVCICQKSPSDHTNQVVCICQWKKQWKTIKTQKITIKPHKPSCVYTSGKTVKDNQHTN